MARTTVIRAETLFDGECMRDGVTVVVEGERIVEVGKRRLRPNFSGFVTPAFIDAHSHIGMLRQGEPGDEAEANDHTDQFSAVNDPLDSVYFDDAAFAEAVELGVLYSCIVPGSGNLVGGRAMVIRNWAANRAEALVSDYGFKMALGFNPRSTVAWKGTRPNTRMGIYGMLEKRFDAVLAKQAKADIARERKQRELERRAREAKLPRSEVAAERELIAREHALELDAEERALLELLRSGRTVKVHVHKEDDALYLVELARKYGLKVTADHALDIHHREVFDALADAGIRVVYGPPGCLAYKVELRHMDFRNVKLLMESRAEYGLMTDHPVIMAPALRDSLKYFLFQGMSEAEALALVTSRNARILGLDADLGTVAAGKLASLVVWDRDPLHLAAFPVMVMGEGRVLRKRA
jgi:imidazolonepropionase-like amidohydrolase